MVSETEIANTAPLCGPTILIIPEAAQPRPWWQQHASMLVAWYLLQGCTQMATSLRRQVVPASCHWQHRLANQSTPLQGSASVRLYITKTHMRAFKILLKGSRTTPTKTVHVTTLCQHCCPRTAAGLLAGCLCFTGIGTGPGRAIQTCSGCIAPSPPPPNIHTDRDLQHLECLSPTSEDIKPAREAAFSSRTWRNVCFAKST